MHKYIIKNSGQEDEVLHFRDGSSICLGPNETYAYESEEDVMMPYLVSINWGELELAGSEEVTIVGNTRHWSVTIPESEPFVPGSWKKEGF